MLKIRKSENRDIKRILKIYAKARKFMKEHNNPQQWKDNKPSEEQLREDIRNGHAYVVTDEKDYVLLTFALLPSPDPTYLHIEGKWKDDSPYVVIHRLASSMEQRGLSSFLFTELEKKYFHIRIDTHQDNIPMQNLVKKFSFTFQGIIYLQDKSPRLAYEWVSEEMRGKKK